MKAYPLRKFVHRVLLVRLALATGVIAVVAGLIVYRSQQAQLEREVADLGRRGAAALVERVRDVMAFEKTDARDALQKVLGGSSPPVDYRAGQFVLYQIYDRAGTVMAEVPVANWPDIEGVRAAMAAQSLSFPEAGRVVDKAMRIGGGHLVYMIVPVTDRTGNAPVFIRGMFAVSPQALQLMRRAAVRSTVFVIGVVIAVSALLYPVILRLTRRLADYSGDLLEANLETLAVLGSAIAKRDSDTDAHNYRVTLYSTMIAEALGLDAAEMRVLIKGAFLHDVGKLGIPDAILRKPAPLDAQEFTVMKSHVEQGTDIVKRSSWLREGVEVVRHHHEKFAGGGYPHGLQGKDIPVTARIFAVSDVFDALTSRRPYKQPISFEEAFAILERDRGKHFDPAVLDAFGKISRDLYDRYAGRDGADLKAELNVVVTKYFSSGLETLQYGEGSFMPGLR